MTKKLVAGIQQAADEAGVDLCSDSISGMFGWFFQKGPVNNFQDAKKSDTDKVCLVDPVGDQRMENRLFLFRAFKIFFVHKSEDMRTEDIFRVKH